MSMRLPQHSDYEVPSAEDVYRDAERQELASQIQRFSAIAPQPPKFYLPTMRLEELTGRPAPTVLRLKSVSAAPTDRITGPAPSVPRLSFTRNNMT